MGKLERLRPPERPRHILIDKNKIDLTEVEWNDMI